jgi:hypothetical protein
MKLTNMMLPKKKNKSETAEVAPMDYDSKPRYPYGLEIRLEKEALDKLGINVDNMSIGSKCNIEAKAKVVNLSKNASEGRDSASASLQITDLAVHKVGSAKKLKDMLKKTY